MKKKKLFKKGDKIFIPATVIGCSSDSDVLGVKFLYDKYSVYIQPKTAKKCITR
jgi:hypothetical protein